MFLTKICVILISVLFISGLAEQAALNNTEPFPLKLRPDSDIGPHQLVYLGSVDGSAYYVEKDIKRNWGDAKKLCEGFAIKLKLATVKSRAQYDFLMKHLQEEWYWVGAQEFMTDKAFRWDGTAENPVNYGYFEYASNKHWCLVLRSAARQAYRSDICMERHPTLCQLYT